MAKFLEIYKCKVCGNIVEVLHPGAGELTCCGEPMKLMEEQTADKTTEKHVPLIEKTENGYKITVGSTLHPMVEEHYIEWIQLLAGDKAYRAFLKPGMEPITIFCEGNGKVTAREYCNIHELWKGEE